MNNQTRNRVIRRSQQGLTMIELMIAMLLGLILMGGVIQIFIGSKQTYNLQEAQSRLQENGRLAMHFLPHDIRLVDFQGCRSRQNYTANVIADPTAANAPDLDLTLWNPNGGITGTDNVTAGTTIGTVNVAAGTDIINLQFGNSCGGNLVGNMTGDSASIQIDAGNSCNLEQNFAFMITDCVDADIVRASSVSNGSGKQTLAHANNVNSGTRLSKAYGDNAEVYSMQSAAFFIGQNPVGNNALYRRDNAVFPVTTTELVEGVQDMQILYGEDTDGDGTANYYVNAASVVSMQQVVSVKISLLMQSLSNVNVTSQPVAYTYNGVDYDVNGATLPPVIDRQLRKVYTSTVTVRNRLP